MNVVYDTESFIVAVKERPSLWDLSSDEYSNRVLRKKMWEEVTMLFGGSECSTQKEKTDLCSTLQKKWRHIKDSYCREKRKTENTKSGSGATKRSPYVYFNLLSFLNNATPPTKTQSSIDPLVPLEEEVEAETNERDSPKGPYETTTIAKKRKPQDEIGKQLINVLKQSAEDRRRRENDALQDEDKLFLLSLLGDFKKIPQDMKLSAKRQMLTVIEQHQGQQHRYDPCCCLPFNL